MSNPFFGPKAVIGAGLNHPGAKKCECNHDLGDHLGMAGRCRVLGCACAKFEAVDADTD